MSRFKIEGIVPVIPSPFDDEEKIDWTVLRGLLDLASAVDVEAVCLPAYASEFYKLTETERRESIVLAVDHLKGKLRVVAQVNYPSTLQAARSAREAQADGAFAICCAVYRECFPWTGNNAAAGPPPGGGFGVISGTAGYQSFNSTTYGMAQPRIIQFGLKASF